VLRDGDASAMRMIVMMSAGWGGRGAAFAGASSGNGGREFKMQRRRRYMTIVFLN
jgi:hypothetical protein